MSLRYLFLGRNILLKWYKVRSVQIACVNTINIANAATLPVPEEPDEKPVKFLGSQAQSWRAKQSRSSEDESKPWYEPFVVSLSIAIFLIYFCILREENDIDEELGKSLYERVDGLEEQQLNLSLKYNEEHGLDTKPIVDRLKEIKENL